MKNHILLLICICLASTGYTRAVNSTSSAVNGYASLGENSLIADPPPAGSDQQLVGFFNGFSVGGSAGVGLFHGSLADYNIFAPFSDFSTYYKFGWRAYVQRDIAYGLVLKLGFEKGQLAGGRLPGKQSIPVDFETRYNTINLSAAYNLLDLMTKKDGLKNQKFYLFGEIGIGLTLFRSVSYWRAEDNRPRDFVGYTPVDPNPPTQRYTLDTKTAPAKALNVPVGFTFGYRMNYKTDVTFSYTLNNLSTQRLDTWDRDYAAQDKYSYFGLGIRYNFNRDKSEYPKKKSKERKKKESSKEDVAPKSVNLQEPIQSRKSGAIVPEKENAQLEDVKLKMFELQLKLFEMQYLLNGGNTTPAAAPPPSK